MVAETLSIGEVADRAGLRTSAIRFYERAGVLPAPERQSGRRRYDPNVVELLRFVRFCQRVGFSLTEVRELVSSPGRGSAKERWRELVDAKLVEVEALIHNAQAVRGVLQESRDCDCVSLADCEFVDDRRVVQ